MQQIDCINQQARERNLTKRSQAERLAIANSLIASVWKEYLNGSIDRSTLQVAAYIQTDVNRIVWKLNELNNPNSPNISKALDALDCISRQKAIDAFDCTDELIVGGSANAQNVMNYINKVIGKIKALPSVQPEQRWIPCTPDTMPKKPEQVLIYAWNAHYVLAKYREIRTWEGIYKMAWVVEDAYHAPFEIKHDVIAWMPLPGPYKPPTRSQYRRMQEQKGEQE